MLYQPDVMLASKYFQETLAHNSILRQHLPSWHEKLLFYYHQALRGAGLIEARNAHRVPAFSAIYGHTFVSVQPDKKQQNN